jgi:hypothetical protein
MLLGPALPSKYPVLQRTPDAHELHLFQSDLAVRITDLNGLSLAGSNYPRAPSLRYSRRKFIASCRAL